MLIHQPNHLKSFVEREVASGRFESEEEVVEVALARIAEDVAPAVTIDEAVAESLTQIARGEGRELTDDVFDELLKLSEEDARVGRSVRDDVKY
jgi:Arc/MetJ-type ribon-helix-helix transcriptional regulator